LAREQAADEQGGNSVQTVCMHGTTSTWKRIMVAGVKIRNRT
jgi:hypothetical protein